MIENKNEISKDLEKALQVLEQAKRRVANEKKKQNEKKRKAEVTYSPRLRGAHKYTTRGGMCALRGASCTCMAKGAYTEVISYNKKNLARELQTKSRQHNRQQDRTKRREKEI